MLCDVSVMLPQTFNISFKVMLDKIKYVAKIAATLIITHDTEWNIQEHLMQLNWQTQSKPHS